MTNIWPSLENVQKIIFLDPDTKKKLSVANVFSLSLFHWKHITEVAFGVLSQLIIPGSTKDTTWLSWENRYLS